jgi:hypothetical protein
MLGCLVSGKVILAGLYYKALKKIPCLQITAGDQAFFGSLLTVQWDPKNNLIRGALLESSATDYRLRPWAGDHQVMILEQHDHKVTANLSFSIECNPIGHSIPKIDFMGGDLRALKVHFKPCILQSHPDCQLLWNHFTSPNEMDYCLPNQSAFGLCITGPQIRLENNFTKLSSSALFPAAHSDFPTGLFSSFHGGHGTEYVLLEYDPLRESLRAVKMTGDANVPRSEWSWLANVRRPIRQSIDDDFYGALVYQAFGHIAFHGFENESSIQCERKMDIQILCKEIGIVTVVADIISIPPL